MSKFNFKSLFSGVEDIAGQANGLKKKLEELQNRKLMIIIAPMNRADVIGFFHSMIDREAARYPALLAQRYQWMQTGQHAMEAPAEMSVSDTDFFAEFLYPAETIGDIQTRNVNQMKGMQAAQCFMRNEQIKEKIADAVNSWDWSGEGLLRDERAKQLAALDAEIAEIENELVELNQGLNKIREAL